ncbi:MAG: PadR family transcriptional regulator [Candidatus Bathyarchaeia archaeon]
MCRRGGPHHRGLRPAHFHRSLPERGWIQFLLLRLLHEIPMHGYQITEELERRGYVRAGRFRTGSVYTILKRMERRGLVRSHIELSDTDRERRVYSVTERGEEALRNGLESILRRKRIMDELAGYYGDRFAVTDLTPRPREVKKAVGKMPLAPWGLRAAVLLR